MRIIFGINPVREALRSISGESDAERLLISKRRKGGPVDEITRLARKLSVKVDIVSPEELKAATGTDKDQGIALEFKGGFPYSDIETIISRWRSGGAPALFVLLDSIEDPQNLGALIRSANAAGADGVLIPKDRSAAVTGVVIKSSAGAASRIPIARVTNLRRAIERLKEENIWVAALDAEGGERPWKTDLSGDIAIVVGSEGKGIRRLVREGCDLAISIPMQSTDGVDSLNAAQAGTVVLFEAVRQRDGGR